jgi:hypothetical protein
MMLMFHHHPYFRAAAAAGAVHHHQQPTSGCIGELGFLGRTNIEDEEEEAQRREGEKKV